MLQSELGIASARVRLLLPLGLGLRLELGLGLGLRSGRFKIFIVSCFHSKLCQYNLL